METKLKLIKEVLESRVQFAVEDAARQETYYKERTLEAYVTEIYGVEWAFTRHPDGIVLVRDEAGLAPANQLVFTLTGVLAFYAGDMDVKSFVTRYEGALTDVRRWSKRFRDIEVVEDRYVTRRDRVLIVFDTWLWDGFSETLRFTRIEARETEGHVTFHPYYRPNTLIYSHPKTDGTLSEGIARMKWWNAHQLVGGRTFEPFMY